VLLAVLIRTVYLLHFDCLKAPTRIMAATDDESVPRQHTEWLLAKIPDASRSGRQVATSQTTLRPKNA